MLPTIEWALSGARPRRAEWISWFLAGVEVRYLEELAPLRRPTRSLGRRRHWSASVFRPPKGERRVPAAHKVTKAPLDKPQPASAARLPASRFPAA